MDKLKFNFRQEAGSDVLDLYIYDEVCADYYKLDENWNLQFVESETSAEYFRRQLEAHKGVTKINLYINSMGGSVVEGYGIYSQLKRHPAKVTAYIDGFACSIASIIACAGDTVIAYPNSMMMIHEMMDSVCGNAKQLRETADALDKIMEGNRKVYLAKSGGKLTESGLIAMLRAETWMTAQDCLQYGLVDEVKDEGGMTVQQAGKMMQQANHSFAAELEKRKLMTQIAMEIAKPEETDNPPAPQPKGTPEPEQKGNPEPEGPKDLPKNELNGTAQFFTSMFHS